MRDFWKDRGVYQVVEFWKTMYPKEFMEAVGEINQGNSAEAYYLVSNRFNSLKYFDADKSFLFSIILDVFESNQS